jgi:hypothetical protein
MSPIYCPCENELHDPCPACGATVSGDDAVLGVCQALRSTLSSESIVSLVLISRDTGEVVASTH